MPRFTLSLAATCLFVLPLAAQTTGTATVRTACTAPAPAGSLTAKPLSPKTFTPDSRGVVVMEMEHVAPFGGWVLEDNLPGFGGEGFFRWNGPNLFNTPGRDSITFRFEIETPGMHLVRIHSRHDDPDSSAENDCWAKLGNEPWDKLFHNWGPQNIKKWNYNAIYESTGDFPMYDLSAGVHEFFISGRSTDFMIDRVTVLPFNVWFGNTNDPQSDVKRSRPVLGSPVSVEIDDPTNAAGLTPGATLTVWYAGNLSANYPCGSVYGNVGEFLVELDSALEKEGAPQVWMGPGNPNTHTYSVPLTSSILGAQFATQGAFLDTVTGRVVLTDAVDLVVGDQ